MFYPAVSKQNFRSNLKIGSIYILKKNPLLDRFPQSNEWGFLNSISDNKIAKSAKVNDTVTVVDYSELVCYEGQHGGSIFTYKILYDGQMWQIALSEHDEVFCFEEVNDQI